MFRRRIAFLKGSARTKKCKSNTPIQLMRAISTQISMHFFVLHESVTMTLPCRNMQKFDICHELYFFECVRWLIQFNVSFKSTHQTVVFLLLSDRMKSIICFSNKMLQDMCDSMTSLCSVMGRGTRNQKYQNVHTRLNVYSCSVDKFLVEKLLNSSMQKGYS